MGQENSEIKKIYDRIEVAVTHFDFGKERLATEIFEKVNLQGYYNSKSKEIQIRPEVFAKIKIEMPELNLNWLITGKGNMVEFNYTSIAAEAPEQYGGKTQMDRIENLVKEIFKMLKK